MNKVNIIITHKCNLQCKHCYMSAGNSDYEDLEKIFESFKSIIIKLKKSGVKEVMLTGGECTTSPIFLKILDYCKQLDIKTSIFTNGMILNTKICDYVDDYNLSLDGLKAYHNSLRGNKNSYDNVLRAIKILKEHNKNITVQMTVTSLNVFQIIDVTKLLYQLGIKKINLCCLLDDGRSIDNNLDSNIDILKFKKIVKETYKKTGYNIAIHTNIFDDFSANTFLKSKSITFPLWIDLVNNSFYIIKDNSILSNDLLDFSENSVNVLNEKVNNYILKNVDYLLQKKNYILENEILYLLSRGDSLHE